MTALYQALPFLPNPKQHYLFATEGVRSNITDVFNAIALYNSYPAAYFDELAWNQMILKALFVGSPLYMIQGLEDRANFALAKMLVDYAHERWAAKRAVSPELWRTVGRFADTAILTDLKKLLLDSDITQNRAGALAIAQCPLPEAAKLLASYPGLRAAIKSGGLTWTSLRISSYSN